MYIYVSCYFSILFSNEFLPHWPPRWFLPKRGPPGFLPQEEKDENLEDLEKERGEYDNLNIKEVDYSFLSPPIVNSKNYLDKIFMDKIDPTLDEDGIKVVRELKLKDRFMNKKKKVKVEVKKGSIKSAKIVPVEKVFLNPYH
jgi:hypothetical protein